jgi:threonine dehydrogenase-like Zn-dependent dehydrogenase
MKVVVCEKPGRLALIDRPQPTSTQGEVLVQIRRIGVCGTDFHIFGGKHPFLEYLQVMGHELSGTVVTTPEGSALEPGQNVYIVTT